MDCSLPGSSIHGIFQARVLERGAVAFSHIYTYVYVYMGFPSGSDGKASTCNAADLGSIPGPGRSPGEEIGYPLQYSCLENLMNRKVWWARVHGVTKSWTQLSNQHLCVCVCIYIYVLYIYICFIHTHICTALKLLVISSPILWQTAYLLFFFILSGEKPPEYN